MASISSPIDEPIRRPVVPVRETYLNNGVGLRSWLLTVDHKRIAWLYLIVITVMFLLGSLAAMVMRLELTTAAGDVVEAEWYNRLFTMHGVIMIFLFLVPSIPAVLGNFFIPMMVGARDVAFPRLNLLSWYVYMLGAAFILYALLVGGADTGWTFYTPLSTTNYSHNVVPTALGIVIVGFSSILTGLNFLVTIHKMRAPGLTWFKMQLFLWSLYATSLIQVLATPVLAITLLLMVVERVLRVGIFDPALGGDPILFQHMFWFYSHPAVYIMILPGMGVVSELISAFTRKNVFGYKFVAMSSVAIAVYGFLVWGHHLFVAGQSVYAALVFSVLSFFVAIPSAIKVFNWTATFWRASVSLQTPMLYAIGFIGLFVVGGLTGLFLAALALDVHLSDTYFVVAHFHYIMVGGMLLAYLGGLHYWWPKMTGRMYPEFLGKMAAIIVFVGFNLTFLPQFVAGVLGNNRRYYAYDTSYEIYQVLSTAGSTVLGLGFILPLGYLTWSLRYGRLAPENPWGSAGLEWQSPTPPPTENFLEQPVVVEGPHHYTSKEVVVG